MKIILLKAFFLWMKLSVLLGVRDTSNLFVNVNINAKCIRCLRAKYLICIKDFCLKRLGCSIRLFRTINNAFNTFTSSNQIVSFNCILKFKSVGN